MKKTLTTYEKVAKVNNNISNYLFNATKISFQFDDFAAGNRKQKSNTKQMSCRFISLLFNCLTINYQPGFCSKTTSLLVSITT